MSGETIESNTPITSDESDKKYDPNRYAAIYARKSIKNPNYSLPSQIEICKKRIDQENLILYKVYKDEVSGNDSYLKRKAFSKLLNDLYAGMFKTVVVMRMDRLSRRIDDFLKIQSIFEKHNVRVIYVHEGELNIFDKSYMSKFIRNIVMSISTFEPDSIKDKTNIGKKRKRERGEFCHGKTVPYGFKYDKKNKYYYVNEEEAKNIREIFKIYYDKIDELRKKDSEGKILTKTQLVEEIKNKINLTKRVVNQTFIDSLILNPIYAKRILINPKVKLIHMIIYDEVKNYYKFDESNLKECTNIDKEIIPFDCWKTLVLKILAKKVQGDIKAPEFLFKKLLYCNKCKKSIHKYIDEEHYRCNKGCTKVTQDEIIKLLIAKLIEDFKNEDIKVKFKAQIGNAEKQIAERKSSIEKNNHEIKKKIHLLVKEPQNQKLKEEILELQKKNRDLKDEIQKQGLLLRDIHYRIENIDILKSEIIRSNNEDIEFFIQRWREFHELVSNLIYKVVISKSDKDDNYSITTEYQ